MNNFYKYLLIILGASALFDAFNFMLGFDTNVNFKIFSLKVSKAGYIIYKLSIGIILLVSAFKIKKAV